MLFTGTAALSVVPHLRKAPYVIRDFEPIGNVTATPLIVTARGNAPFKTLAELLAHARANPGKVNMGSAGSGTSTHIVGEAFRRPPESSSRTYHSAASGPLPTPC